MTKPNQWDPRAEPDKLATLAQLATAMWEGKAAFEQRISELAAGYPSAGSGGGSGEYAGNGGGPTLAAVKANLDDGRQDPADKLRKAFEVELTKALNAAAEMWAEYRQVTTSRMGVSKFEVPGCDLCTKVPCGGTLCPRKKGTGPYRCETIDAHWCPVYASIEVTEDGPKGAPTKRIVALCSSCYEFNRPDRAGRLPTHDEVLDHVEGRRRRYRVGA